MPNSRTPHPLGTFNISVSISIVARKKHLKKPHHPSKVHRMKCFTANASGRCFRFSSLHFRSYTSFRHLTFHSVHCQPPASATHARVPPSFHFAQAYPPFHYAPLWLPYPQPETRSQNGKLHSTPPNSLHCIQSPPLLFPMPTSGMPCGRVSPEKPKPQIPHRPLMVQVKIKEGYLVGLMLAAGSSHSFIRSPFRSCLTTQLPTSFVHRPASAPHVCVFRASHPHFPHPQKHYCRLFLPADCLPHNPIGLPSLSLKMCLLLYRQGF